MIRDALRGIYRFLPVQLVLLHFRKYQILLLFWVIVVLTVTGHIASTFGADTLFLAPEYLGQINFMSMLLLGGATAVFVMAWHITTFIINSQRVPFMGATRQAFLKYCINNSIIPLCYLIFYSIISIRFQWFNEHADITTIIRFQLGFYLGFLLILLISFLYFFRVDRDLLKVVLSRITNPGRIREIIPYDSLDFHEIDIIRADTYLTGMLKIRKCTDLESYHPRLLHTVLRKHHRNAITATVFALVLLMILGAFMEEPVLRIPAGAGFLILFSIIMGMFGAMKYLLRSWEVLGWVFIAVFIGWLVKKEVFDMRSIAYGMKYEKGAPEYNYDSVKNLFTPHRYYADINAEEERLEKWKARAAATTGTRPPPMVVIGVSGGGSRSAYWTFRSLQYIDSLTEGALFRNTVLITGASGGMIGAAYWRELHNAHQDGKISNPYDSKYQTNIGKDLLNAIIFSFVSIDMVSPFNKISWGGYSYTKDRGYAFDQELIRTTEGILDKKIGDYQMRETEGATPALIINSTIMNDGRKLLISPRPISYLCQPAYALGDTAYPPIDAIDFAAFFEDRSPYDLRLPTALRMNATFPYILPVVKLPSDPYMNIMDAGLRDNFGTELISRYLHVMQGWIENNVRDVIYLEIRDTREHQVFPSSEMNTLTSILSDPLFVIQNKWAPFQSFVHGYIKDHMPHYVSPDLHVLTLQYIPAEREKAAALNFHLTTKEKRDIYYSMYHEINLRAADTLVRLLRRQSPGNE